MTRYIEGTVDVLQVLQRGKSVRPRQCRDGLLRVDKSD